MTAAAAAAASTEQPANGAAGGNGAGDGGGAPAGGILNAQQPANGQQAAAPANGQGAQGGQPAGEPANGGQQKQEPVYDLKLPEGSALPKEAAEQITALAKKIGITPEHAQALLNEHATAHKTQADAQAKALADQDKAWQQQIAADRELGGPNLQATTIAAQRAIAKFAPPDVQEMIRAYGFGNHPGLVRMFAQIGKLIGEGGLPGGSSGAQPQDARAIYTSMPNP